MRALFFVFLLLSLSTPSFGYAQRLRARRLSANQPTPQVGRDIMNTADFRLLEYRKMFKYGVTPHPSELVGYWRGVNKGIVELVGYHQFIKEILPDNNGVISGDNLMVNQVDKRLVRSLGWEFKRDPLSNGFQRQGKFAVLPPDRRGRFGHGAVFSYRYGNNRRGDPVRLLVDRVVMIDANHLLGRVTAKLGVLEIPLAYFVLERVNDP